MVALSRVPGRDIIKVLLSSVSDKNGVTVSGHVTKNIVFKSNFNA
jgi:hypothetical protein